MEGNIGFALGLTVFAELSTGVGSLIGFVPKELKPRFLSAALGFSAGVMIYVSLVEIFVKARDSLAVGMGAPLGYFVTVVSFFAEPIGALLGYFVLRELFNESLFGMVFGAVAGILDYISLDELLPTAEEYGEHHVAITGVILGMVVMAGSLLLFS